MNTSDYLLACGRAEDVAVVEVGTRVTYAGLRDAAARLAAELAALDLPRSSSVGLLGPGSTSWIAGYLAAMKLGHVAVPFSDEVPAEEIARQAELVDCAAVLMDRRSRRAFGGAFAADAPVVTDAVLQSAGPSYWPELATDPDATAALMFASGTSARPKAVRLTHRDICAGTESVVRHRGLRRHHRMRVVLPFFHCLGASLLHAHLRAGASLALCGSFGVPELAPAHPRARLFVLPA